MTMCLASDLTGSSRKASALIPRFRRPTQIALVVIFSIGIVHVSGQTPLATSQLGICETAPLADGELAEITSSIGSGDASNNSASPEILLATGSPADDATREIATTLVDEFVSCTNSGEVMSVLALGTDNFIRAYANWAMPGNLMASDLGVQPNSIELQEVDPIRSYRNGSIAAFAQVASGHSGNEFQIIVLVLTKENDTWKIASIIPGVTYRSGIEVPADAIPGTPLASPVE